MKRGEKAWQSLTIRLEKWEWFDRYEKINEIKQMQFVFKYEITISGKWKHEIIIMIFIFYLSVC